MANAITIKGAIMRPISSLFTTSNPIFSSSKPSGSQINTAVLMEFVRYVHDELIPAYEQLSQSCLNAERQFKYIELLASRVEPVHVSSGLDKEQERFKNLVEVCASKQALALELGGVEADQKIDNLYFRFDGLLKRFANPADSVK